MIEHNIRHLPIIHEDENGKEYLAGMISMRDAFKALHEIELINKNKKIKLDQAASNKISVIAKNSREKQLQKNLLNNFSNIVFINENFEELNDPTSLIPKVIDSKICIIDIDHFSSKFWSIFLKLLLDEIKRPEIFVVFNPHMHDKKSVDVLKTISFSRAVHAFTKPINLLQYLNKIELISSLSE
jgi:hypothetical protein